jgi:y4mF family transcriptional regulator
MHFYTLIGIILLLSTKILPKGYNVANTYTPFSTFLKQKRKETNLTQEQLALKAGVGLRFIRELEQGKKSIRLDKVNAVLSLFGYEAGPVRQEALRDDT